MNQKKLLIVDGSALLTTCYYGTLPPEIKFSKNHDNDCFYYGKILHAADGTYTNGIFSFMKRLEKIIREQAPTHLAVTFDVTRNTFRKKLYSEYKANRKETPEPLAQQRKLLPQILISMGISVFASPDYEGDDIIGSLSERFRNEIPVYILVNDHDMMQLVKPGVQMWYTCQSQSKAEEMFYDYTQGENGLSLADMHLPDGVFPFGRDSIKWNMGVYPEQIPDLKGLSGDNSDNIPGVKGISEKTATLLLSKYGSLNKLFEVVKNTNPEELKKIWKEELGISRPPIKALLAEDAEKNAKLSLKLATIVTNLCFPVNLANMELHINNDIRKKYYEQLGFKSLLMPNVA